MGRVAPGWGWGQPRHMSHQVDFGRHLGRFGGWMSGLLLVGFVLGLQKVHALTPIPQKFRQEVARHHDAAPGLPAGPVQLVDVTGDGVVRVFAGGRWYRKGEARWEVETALDPAGSGEFRLLDGSGKVVTVKVPWSGVRQVLRRGAVQWVVTSADPVEIRVGQEPKWMGWPSRLLIHQAAVAPDGRLWVASSGGLFQQVEGGWRPETVLDAVGRSWATTNVLAVAFDSAGSMWMATRAGVAVREGAKPWRFFEGKDGLPWNDFTGAAAGPDGSVWFGTRLGLIRWDGTDFHYRQGRRWLPSDDVRQLTVDGDGGVWAATEGGLGRIEFRSMTLAEKAALYEREVEQYVKRTPYGFVAEAPLKKAGDRSTAAPEDSDNDGLWTAMYGAGECFGYAATRDPAAKARAKQAFEALRFLQKVTQGGDPAPARGYVARTVRPMDWPDPNVGRLESDKRAQANDILWKAYEPRWPKSADGKWYWKGDTSSDELDGHYFFYAAYYDHCADTEEEKARVREVVKDLTDHMVSHGFNLVDVDGKVTRWGVYGPQDLNHNQYWWVERGLNSLSMLSYLAVTAHVTGDERYRAIAKELVENHGYAQNLMFPKVQQGPGSGNQSDDEMAFMCFYNLIRYGNDPATVDRVRYSFFQYWANDAAELNPFFHFAYAGQNLGQSITNGWGVFDVSPWPGWLEDSRATLYGMPLDRLNWGHRNSHRLDVVRLWRVQSRDLYEEDRAARGHRVNLKVVPVENRHFNHWNTDPWHLDYGGNGNELGAGTVFLLPYYMGMYHGYVEKP
jgi:hypothetical protein